MAEIAQSAPTIMKILTVSARCGYPLSCAASGLPPKAKI
jgi:hypothetical protein